jgi:adenosylhomocysteine nucleosidase
MTTVGIIGAMQLEIEALMYKLDNVEERVSAKNKYYLGKLCDINVVITSSGVGKVNAASCTQILISEYKVDYIVNTGIAGSMNGEVHIGDVVISSDVVHHDVRQEQLLRCHPYKEVFKSDDYLMKLATEIIKEQKGFKYNHHIGRIVSGEGFINSNNEKQRIISLWNPLCVEMEGSAIGHVAYMNNIPFVVIRCISDNADDEATINYEQFELQMAKQSVEIVYKIISKIN